jgi:hypothetical protein
MVILSGAPDKSGDPRRRQRAAIIAPQLPASVAGREMEGIVKLIFRLPNLACLAAFAVGFSLPALAGSHPLPAHSWFFHGDPSGYNPVAAAYNSAGRDGPTDRSGSAPAK